MTYVIKELFQGVCRVEEVKTGTQETNWLAEEGIQATDDGSLNQGVTNGDDKQMKWGYISKVTMIVC